MNGRFKYLKSRETCNVCRESSKGCRELHKSDGILYFCRGENPGPDYHFLNYDKSGIFGLYIDQKDKEIQDKESEEERKRRREEYIAQRKAKEEEQAREYANGLPLKLRDEQFRKLINQLPLHGHHKQDLERRGLSPEQIEKGMFRSVSVEGTKLSIPISQFLPGAWDWGQSFKVTKNGYLCPIFNTEGLIIGAQIRADDASNGNKYSWLKTKKSSHLQNGELPLTIHITEGDKNLRLAEGVLKPYVAHCNHNQNYIGAAGGNFASSPQQLKEYIDKVNPEKIILTPDAGSRANKHVVRQYQGIATLLQLWEIELWVEDWGQSDNKNNCDIDEIPPSTNTTIIPFSEWLPKSTNSSNYKSPRISKDQYTTSFKFPRQIKDTLKSLAKTIKAKVTGPAYKYWRKHGLLPKKYELHPLEKKRIAQEKLAEAKRLSETTTTITKWEPPLILIPIQIKLDDDPKNWVLPSNLEDWQKEGKPKYIIPHNLRNDFEVAMIERGFKFLFDQSATGTGKSHDAGNLPYALGIDPHKPKKSEGDTTVFYICDDPRNPTTEKIERYSVCLPSRHSGLKEHATKLTPMGYPHIYRPKNNEVPTIPASCIREPVFRYFPKAKNIFLPGGKNSPACEGCPRLLNDEDKVACSLLVSRGQTTQEYSFIRAHPQQLSPLSQQDIAIIDEAGKILKSTKDIFISDYTLNNALYELGDKLIKHQINGFNYGHAIKKAILPLIEVMKEIQLFVENSPQHKKYGMNHHEFIDHVFEKLANLYCSLSIITEDELNIFLAAKSNNFTCNHPNFIDIFLLQRIKGSWIEKLINRALWNLSSTEFITTSHTNNIYLWGVTEKIDTQDTRTVTITPTVKDVIDICTEIYKPNLNNLIEDDNLPWEIQQQRIDSKCKLNFLSPLLKILSGAKGYIQAKNHGFNLTLPDNHIRRSLLPAKSILYKDATAEVENIAIIMGIDANDIVQYQVPTPSTTNLTIHLVNGFGNCGGQRSNALQKSMTFTENSLPTRLVHAVKAIPKNKSTALIDFQGHLHNYQDIKGIDYLGYWWVDNRGTNKLLDYDLMIGIGNPTANLGAKAAEFQTLTGQYANPTQQTTEFQRYIQNSIDNEKLQLIGRLRANLQPHKKKDIYLLGNYSQNFFNQLKEKFPGCTVKKKMSYDLCPLAATRRDYDTKRAIEYGLKLFQMGEKITQEKIAKGIGSTQSWVSKIFKNLGGYKKVIQLFHSLNKFFLRKWNNPEKAIQDMPEEARWCLEHLFPLEVEDFLNKKADLHELIETLNLNKEIHKIDLLEYLSMDILFKLILGIIAHLPEEYQKIFEEVILEPPEPVPI